MSWLSCFQRWLRRQKSRRRGKRFCTWQRPAVEFLEPRNLLAANFVDMTLHYVTGLYSDVLHRTPQQAEVYNWGANIALGMSRAQVTQIFTQSAEYRANLINATYQLDLGRSPESGATDNWLRVLQAGLSEEQFSASLLASDEAYARSGNQPDAWLKFVYEVALVRNPGSGELGSWLSYFQSGVTRQTVAFDIVHSPEAHAQEVITAYQQILGRSPEPSGLMGWTAVMNRGLTMSQLIAALASSDEYYDAQAGVDLPVSPPPASSGNPNGPFVSIMAVSGVHGVNSSIPGLTNDALLTAYGVATPGLSFVLSADGLPDSAVTVDSTGHWHVALPGPLSEGSHTIMAKPLDSSITFDNRATYLLAVDLTPPSVILVAPAVTTDPAPLLTLDVRSSDTNGINGIALIDVSDSTRQIRVPQVVALGQTGPTQATLNALAPGTYQLTAQVTDLAGNEGVSPPVTIQIVPPDSPITPSPPVPRPKVVPPPSNPPPVSPQPPVIAALDLQDLVQTYQQLTSGGGSPPGMPPSPPSGFPDLAAFFAFEKQVYVFDGSNDILLRVRVKSRDDLRQGETELLGLQMNIVGAAVQQNMIIGYMPLAGVFGVMGLPDYQAVTPVYAAIRSVGAVTTQGDSVIQSDQFRAQTGLDGTGVTVAAISDSVNQVDSHVDSNPDKGIAESQRTGDLPASGVNVLQDGSSTDTDEGRGLLEIVHDIAPGASLAFTSSDPGPQAMAQGIVKLATQAGANVIVDDVSYPDEPFFNDGVVAQAVNEVVNENNVVYVTSAGNLADHAWSDAFRPVTATVGGIPGQYENLDGSGGQSVLQQFVLGPGQTLNLAFQWDAAFLEGGSPLPQYQVPNNLAVYVVDATGQNLLKRFDNINTNTGEALQRVVFTNTGTTTRTYALAFRWVSGPAPTLVKWIRFDNNAPAQYQGAPAIWGHAAAQGALTVGAVPVSAGAVPEPFTSQGPATILFDAGGHRLATPEIRNKPDVAGPDGVHTANFPGVPAGQSLPPGTYPTFFGTSAAAAHVAGAAALVRQQNPAASGTAIADGLIAGAQHIGAGGWDPQTGAGLIDMLPGPQIASPAAGPMVVGPIVDISSQPRESSTSGGTPGPPGNGPILNGLPVDISQHVNNEWETDIGIDPTNPSHLFAVCNQDTSAAGLFVGYSTDSGATWKTRFIADGSDSFTKACCDPSVSWDTFGNLFLVYLNDAATEAVLLLSQDGGKTFSQIATFAAADQPKVATGANSVWVLDNNGDVEAAGAPVTGLGAVGTFSSLETVPNSTNGNFGNIAIGPQGQVLVSFQNSGSGAGPDAISTALDPDGLGPAGFNNPSVATATNVGSFRTIPAQPLRTIDADGRLFYDRSPSATNGRVYLDYTDAPSTTSNSTDIFVRYSDDNGTTWSVPLKVNDDTTGNSHFWPHLAVDQSNGDIAVSWYDARNDPGFGPGDTDGIPNDDVEFFAAVSHDGGFSFSQNVQVSIGPSTVVNNPNNSNDFGDYTGIAFFQGVFYPVWADNSNSTGTNPDGKGSGLDMYTAHVTVPPPPPVTLGDDRFEPNDTSDRATFLGVLAGTQTFTNLTIDRHANGLFDYDWYRWTAGTTGTFTVDVANIQANGGDLNVRVYTLNAQNTLIQLGSSRKLGGVRSQSVKVQVNAGEPLLVWVYGYNHALGSYDLGVNLA